MSYQTYRDNCLKEKQSEKERIEKEKEIEIINNCKTIKKPKKNVEEFCNRMYEEAKRRQIKQIQKKEIYENEEKSLAASNNNFIPGFSKDHKTEKNTLLDIKNNTKNKSASKYNFQVHKNPKNYYNKIHHISFFNFFRFPKLIYKSINFY